VTLPDKQARAIRLDKSRIKNMAQEISHFIHRKLGNLRGPQGKRVLHKGIPFDITAVDGTPLHIEIVLQAIPSKDFRYVVSGGVGKRGGKPVAVVFFNGSNDFQETVRSAKGSRVVQDQIYAVLIHELTHAADKFTKGVGDRMTQEEAQGNAAYYNDPSELRAYMQEVVDEAERFFDKIPILQEHFGPQGMTYLLKMSPTWKEVSPHWTRRNQQLVMKAVAQAYDDWQQRGKVAAPSVPYPTDQYQPTKPELWRDVLEVASGDRRELRIGDRIIHSPNDGRGYDNMPHHPNGIAWAVKQYNGFMGGWRKEATTKNYDRAKKIIEEFGRPLRGLNQAAIGLKFWNRGGDQPGFADEPKLEQQSRELQQLAARASKDLAIVFEDVEKGKVLQKHTLFRRAKNFHKMLKAWAGAKTPQQMQEVFLKQTTKSKDAYDKFWDYSKEMLLVLSHFDSEVEETLKIDNYTVSLVTSGRAVWSRDLVRKLEEILKRTNQVLKKIGLGTVTGGRVFAYPTDHLTGAGSSRSSSLANYNIPTDQINLAAAGGDVNAVTHSMVHELGHRLYFKVLSGQGRKAWEQFFGDNVQPPDVDKIIRDWEAWANSNSGWATEGGRGRYISHYYSEAKNKLSDDEMMWLKIVLDKADISEKVDKRRGDVDTKGTPGLDQLIAKKGEIKAFLYPVSAYSATNPEELFAEVVADYAYKGPGKVPEIVRDAFSRAAPMVKSAAEDEDKLPGGLADQGEPDDLDPQELAMGIKVEREHTDDPAIAREVALDHLTEDEAYYSKLKEMEKRARQVWAAANPSLVTMLTGIAEGRSMVWEIEPLIAALKLMVPGVKAKATTDVQELRPYNVRGALKVRKVQSIIGDDTRYGKTLIFFKNEKMTQRGYKKIKQVAKIVTSPPKRGKAGELFLKGVHEPEPHPSYDWAIQIEQAWVAYSAYNVTVPEGTFLLVKENRGGKEYYHSVELSKVTRSEKYKSLAHDQLIELGALTPKKQVQKTKPGEGICPACFRGILLKNDKIMRHGWEVQGGRRKGEWGLSWHGGPCFGTKWEPYETSPEGTKAFRKYIQEKILPKAEEDLKKYQGRPDPIVVETNKGMEQIGQTDKRYEQELGRYIRFYKEQVANLKQDIAFLGKAVSDWKPAEIKPRRFTAFQQESLEAMQRGSVVMTDHFETHCQMQELECQKLAAGKASKIPGQFFWSTTVQGARLVTAGLGEELQRRVNTIIQETDDAKARQLTGDLAQWFGANFQRVQSAKTPRGQKRLKEDAQRLLENLDLFSTPGATVSPGGTQRTVETLWKRMAPDLESLVEFFTAEGDKARGKKEQVTELKLSNATYYNRGNLSETNFRKYAEQVDQTFGALKGWRKKALAGNLKVVFVGRSEMKVQGKYKQARDEMLVKATPQVLKRSAGYGTVGYILIHELGHRYEKYSRLPTDFDRDVEWRTTRYSWNDGEAFAELFALGHFNLTGNWDKSKVERFEKVMAGQERVSLDTAGNVLKRYLATPSPAAG